MSEHAKQDRNDFRLTGAAHRLWKRADVTSAVGAGVIGAGIGMLLPAQIEVWAVWVLLAGVTLHVWGMLDKHRLESRAPRLWWAETLYWTCWIILAVLAAAIGIQLWWR